MMTDILKYQISEIDKARITDAREEEKLEKLRNRLKSMELVAKHSGLVYRALAPSEKGASAAYLMERAAQSLRRLSDVMDEAQEMADRLYSYRMDVIDIAERARELCEVDGDVDPEKQLDAVESRLALFSRLKKKYGGDLESVMDFRREAAKKLSALEGGDDRIAELEDDLARLIKEADAASQKLTDIRRKAAEALSAEVMNTLSFLDMPKVRFFASVHRRSGEDRFEKPLIKIASGGEMSRIMLALKCAEAAKAGAGCVVFDEIDTGVSGGTSERIGIKLSELSRGAQVICITHSAQVASHADHHFLIEKREVDGRSESFVREITGSEREEEIARIIGGINITEKQRRAAAEMLEKNSKN